MINTSHIRHNTVLNISLNSYLLATIQVWQHVWQGWYMWAVYYMRLCMVLAITIRACVLGLLCVMSTPPDRCHKGVKACVGVIVHLWVNTPTC